MNHVEDRLRRSLRARAEQIVPGDRLAAIRAGVGAHELAGDGSGRRSRWVALGAAAAAVAIALSVWAVGGRPGSIGQPGDSPEPSPTVSLSSVTPTSTPSAASTSSPSLSDSPSPSATSSEVVEGLTSYIVTDEVAGSPRGVLGLRRVVHPSAVPRAEVGLGAARLAVLGTEGSAVRWPGGVAVLSVAASANEIAVTLSTGGSHPGLTREEARLAILAVVYTVQDALDSRLPVRFLTADGSTTVLTPEYPSSVTWWRAPKGEEYRDLVDVLITRPTPAPVVENQYPSGASVVITGEATAYEAMVHWELTLKGVLIKSGDVMASEGAPGRGEFTITLKRLADSQPETYLLTVQSRGGESGDTVLSSDSVRFSVGEYS